MRALDRVVTFCRVRFDVENIAAMTLIMMALLGSGWASLERDRRGCVSRVRLDVECVVVVTT